MWDCYSYGGEWTTPRLHFDTTLDSMLTLLTIQTTEGWTGVLFSSVDAVQPYYQPKLNNMPIMVFYTMLLVIFIEGMNGLAASYDSVHYVLQTEADAAAFVS